MLTAMTDERRSQNSSIVLAGLADRLKLAWPIDAADLNQHRWLKVEPALVIVLDAIAVLLRRESGCRPLAGINLQARDVYVFLAWPCPLSPACRCHPTSYYI